MRASIVARMEPDTKETQTIFLSISNLALAKGDLPDAITLLRYGDNPTDRGILKVTDRTIQMLAAQRKGELMERVLLDFEHNSVKESPTYQPPPRHHAGAGMVFAAKDRGIGLEAMEWTPKGREYARNYPDVSPCLQIDKRTNEVVGLLSAGLVPNSGVVGVSFSSLQAQPNEKGLVMEDIKRQLDQVITWIAELREKIKALEALKSDAPEAFASKLTETETAVKTLRADFESELAKRDKDALLTQAAFAGKVVQLSDDAVAKLSVADLKAHIDAIDPTVPLHKRTFAAAKHEPGTEGTLIDQYNAITDPAKRAEFWSTNRDKLMGKK